MARRRRPARRRLGGDRLIGSGRLRRLGAAAGITAAGWLSLWDLRGWLLGSFADPYTSDVRGFYVAAQIGLREGWSHLYDLQLQRAYAVAVDPLHRPAPAFPVFGSPPPLAWLAAPLTALPLAAVYVLTAAVALSALATCWWLVAPGGTVRKTGLGLVALAAFPVVHGLAIGNVAVAGAACIGISWALIERRREWLAGVFLVPYVLDPNMAVLVPIAYLLIGRWRPVLVLAVIGGGLAVLSLLSLGATGTGQYLAMLRFNSTFEFNRHLTLLGLWYSPLTVAVQLGLALAALAVAARSRRLDVAFVAAALGSLLVTPYLHLQDLTMGLVGGWVYLRTEAPVAQKLWLVAVFVAAEGAWVFGPAPMLLGFAVWLGLTALPRPARPAALVPST